MRRTVTILITLVVASAGFASGQQAEQQQDDAGKTESAQPKYTTASLRGKVVWMAEAMERRFGVETDPDVAKTLVALETADGHLYPIVKEDRGRGFHKDPRLRGVPMELFVRRYEGSPMIQVIRVYLLRDGKKYELDYWCDICAIPMFELKECECCQGPIRIRTRLVEDAQP